MDSAEKSKSEHYRQVFKDSKNVVLAFEKAFKAKNGRKPGKEDYAKAESNVKTCWKNCLKIQAYFKGKKTERSQSLKEDESTLNLDASSQDGQDAMASTSSSIGPTSFKGLFPSSQDKPSSTASVRHNQGIQASLHVGFSHFHSMLQLCLHCNVIPGLFGKRNILPNGMFLGMER